MPWMLCSWDTSDILRWLVQQQQHLSNITTDSTINISDHSGTCSTKAYSNSKHSDSSASVSPTPDVNAEAHWMSGHTIAQRHISAESCIANNAILTRIMINYRSWEQNKYILVLFFGCWAFGGLHLSAMQVYAVRYRASRDFSFVNLTLVYTTTSNNNT